MQVLSCTGYTSEVSQTKKIVVLFCAGAVLHWIHFLPHYKTLPEPPATDKDDALLRRRDTMKESALQIASYATRPDRKVYVSYTAVHFHTSITGCSFLGQHKSMRVICDQQARMIDCWRRNTFPKECAADCFICHKTRETRMALYLHLREMLRAKIQYAIVYTAGCGT